MSRSGVRVTWLSQTHIRDVCVWVNNMSHDIHVQNLAFHLHILIPSTLLYLVVCIRKVCSCDGVYVEVALVLQLTGVDAVHGPRQPTLITQTLLTVMS
jgi:hypothetical protein